jgi:DnaJ-class molecular chaperone
MNGDMFANNPNIRIFRNGVPVNTVQKPPPIAMVATIGIKDAYTGCKIPVVIERWVKDDNIKAVETETVYINLCKGVDNNEKMILKDKGNVVSERNKSDVILTVRVVNNTPFKRSGLNLVLDKTISLKESLCGFCFDLEHLNGKKFKINNDRGTIIPPNYTKVINSMGMLRDNHVGNLIINFTIDYPQKLTNEQIEQLSRIL